MNLAIEGNGCGKTTLLKDMALAALGSVVADFGLFPYHLIRWAGGESSKTGALVEATFTPNVQDEVPRRTAGRTGVAAGTP